jgi:hypothetical protein
LGAWDLPVEQGRLNPSELAELEAGAIAPTEVFKSAVFLVFFRFGSQAASVNAQVGFFL